MRISDAAVTAKTGRSWDQWFAFLDKKGGEGLDHRGIVQLLSDAVGPWWRQTVAVSYEQARGLRAKHEKPGGFEVSASKTIDVPVSKLGEAWTDTRLGKRWLPESVEIRKATAGKSIRVRWVKDETPVSVFLDAQGETKSRITIQHGRLKTSAAGERMKKYWRGRLTDLKHILEA
jgi:uncharacterized protein YndB with AHSA1/START domain